MASDTDKNTATTRGPAADENRPPSARPGDEGRAKERVADRGAPGTGRKKASQEEIGGRGGLDPTRYGDWEINGRCVDF